MLTFKRRARTLAVILAAVALTSTSAAQSAAVATPELLAEQLPHDWMGLEYYSSRAEVDPRGGAYANISLDSPDGNGGVDVTLSDMGPYAQAALLVLEADAAAGRLERTEIAGFPAFLDDDESFPVALVMLERVLLDAEVFGHMWDLSELTGAVAELPLADIAAVAELPVTPGATYPATGITRNGLRAFLPEQLAGLQRAQGFYSELHPAGVAHGGLDYEGDGGNIRVLIYDLGTAAATSRQRLSDASSEWEPFTVGAYDAYWGTASSEPIVFLLVDRFRVEASGEGAAREQLVEALTEVDWEDLEHFGELVPAPNVRLDPLFDSQPALLSPDELAAVLPEEAMGLMRVDSRSEEWDQGDGWLEVNAQALYAGSDGEPVLMVGLSDEGVLTEAMLDRNVGLTEVELDGRVAYVSAEPLRAQMVVAERVALLVDSAPGAALSYEELLEFLQTVDLTLLLSQLNE